MSLLTSLNASKFVTPKKIVAWRIVEDQSTSTTRKYVDSFIEHDLLENLIDHAKPNIKYYGDEAYFKGLHYLLSTPFRYPPLKWGSRFGSRFERALLYTSMNLETAMSEKAFYKLAFLKASDGILGGKTISYTAFNIHINTEHFLDLSRKPFGHLKKDISSKISYDFTQSLGKEMRENSIECFQYTSARCAAAGTNIGIFSPIPLQDNKQIENTFTYLDCYFTKDIVEFSFKHREKSTRHAFPIDIFLVSGNIPAPA